MSMVIARRRINRRTRSFASLAGVTAPILCWLVRLSPFGPCWRRRWVMLESNSKRLTCRSCAFEQTTIKSWLGFTCFRLMYGRFCPRWTRCATAAIAISFTHSFVLFCYFQSTSHVLFAVTKLIHSGSFINSCVYLSRFYPIHILWVLLLHDFSIRKIRKTTLLALNFV